MSTSRIFFIAPSAYPLGGVAVWLDYLLPGLREHGWDVTLGLTAGRHHGVDDYLAQYPLLGGVVAINNPTGSRQGRVNALMRLIRQQRPDIVVSVNIPDVYEAVNALRKKGNQKTRVVMALHGIQQDLLADAAHYRDVLDGVIATNRLTVRLLEQLSAIEPERIAYAPYGVPVSDGHIDNRNNAQQRIAWVGRIEQAQKRVLDLPGILAALENQCDDYRLVIAGAGPETDGLRQALKDRGVAHRCELAGMIPPERMGKVIYQTCDALLVTSLWETGPITIWEAMAQGVPVVSSRYIGSGLEAGLRHGENCLLFDIGDHEQAARHIALLLGDPELSRHLVKGGHELIKQRYSREVSIQAWHEVLRGILQLSPRDIADLPAISPSGRLDRLLGVNRGERVRRILGLQHNHATAGGEWPHSVSGITMDETEFWWKAKNYDLGEQ